MKTAGRYPYPVLSVFSDDILNSTFTSEITYNTDKQNYYLSYAITLKNHSIQELLEKNKAVLALHAECGKTFYRQLHIIKNFSCTDGRPIEGRIAVPWSQLRGETEINTFIYAAEIIQNYKPEGLHPDYQQSVFILQPGEILAVSGPVKLDLYTDYDPVEKADSIISFNLDKERETGEIRINLNEDKIHAFLPQDLFSKYEALRAEQQKEEIIVALLGIPILMEGLRFIKETATEELSENRGYRWFRSLERKLEEMGINIQNEENVFETAQKLFHNPYMRAAIKLEEINNY